MSRDARTVWAALLTGVLLGGVASLASARTTTVDRWVDAGSTRFPRLAATAVRLLDGRIAVVGGGFASSPVGDLELFDPETGTWSSGPEAPIARKQHRALLLNDGRLLVVGGFHEPTSDNTSPVDLFDPATDAWSSGGFIRPPRTGHTASLLADGRVVVVGGLKIGLPSETLSDVELFDPATGLWTEGEPLPLDRQEHTATLLPSGRLLVTGGSSRGGLHPGGQGAWNDAWLYWPDRDAWGEMSPMRTPRHRHSAVTLADGRVLVSGGALMNRDPIADAEIYDTRLHGWVLAPSLTEPRHSHTSTLLADGRVLVQGGFGVDDRPILGAEVFDPSSNLWSAAPQSPGSYWHAEALDDGSVLCFGGTGLSYLTTAELFDPRTNAWSMAGDLAQPRRFFALSPLADGGLLVRGGSGVTDTQRPPEAERLDPVLLQWEPTTPPPFHPLDHDSGGISLGGGHELRVVSDPAGGRQFFSVRGKRRTQLGETVVVRGEFTATALPGGRALVVGGWFPDADQIVPASRAWMVDGEGVRATSVMTSPRMNHVAIALADGRVLLAGGETDPRHRLSAAEIYDPETDSWTQASSMRSGRISHSAAVLPDGRVVVLAGYGGSTAASRFVPGR